MTGLVQHDDNIFYLHFNIDSHRMPVDQYLSALEGAKDTFDALNRDLFGGKLKYELEVYAPNNGSLKTFLKYLVVAGGVVLDADLRKSFIQGVVGDDPEGFAKNMGEKLTDSADKVVNSEVAGYLHSKCVKGFLEKTPEMLTKAGLIPKQFKKAYEGKNKFYDACSKVDGLKGVGFTDQKDDFPVNETTFHHQMVTFEEEAKQSDWDVSTKERLIVFSPCWDFNEDVKWQAKWQGKKISLEMVDDYFWKIVQEERLENVTTKDVLEVQLAVSKKSGPKTGIVLSVLSYNDQEISQPKSTEEITKVISNYTTLEPVEDNQINLFG